MVKEVCIRRFINFFNAIGGLGGDENKLSDPSFARRDVLTSKNGNRRISSSAVQSVIENVPISRNGLYSVPSLKLEKLKALLLDQAADLKCQKATLEEKEALIEKLRVENELLKNEVQNARTRASHQPRHATDDSSPPSKRRKNVFLDRHTSRQSRLEILSLSPTTSKVRRVRQDTEDHNLSYSLASSQTLPSRTRCKKSLRPSRLPIVDSDKDKSIKSNVRLTGTINTPRWRISTLSSSGILEGTEDITDDAYARRHHKYDVAEKRINKRDKMRERDLELYRRKLPYVSYLPNSSTIRVEHWKHDDYCSPELPDIHAVTVVEKLKKGEMDVLVEEPAKTIVDSRRRNKRRS